MQGHVARKGDRWYAVIYGNVDPDTLGWMTPSDKLAEVPSVLQ